jgi:hypothetical protein
MTTFSTVGLFSENLCSAPLFDFSHITPSPPTIPWYNPYTLAEVTPVLNRYGYRSVEPDFSRRPRSVVYLGCSHTFGQALPLQETWVSILHNQLLKISNEEYVLHNLAVPACSNDTIARIAYGIPSLNPYLVVIFLTYPIRREYIDSITGKYCTVYSHEEALPQGKSILESSNADMDIYNTLKNLSIISGILSSRGIPFIFSIANPHMFPYFVNIPNFTPVELDIQDYAQDANHYGHHTHLTWAKSFYNGILGKYPILFRVPSENPLWPKARPGATPILEAPPVKKKNPILERFRLHTRSNPI